MELIGLTVGQVWLNRDLNELVVVWKKFFKMRQRQKDGKYG